MEDKIATFEEYIPFYNNLLDEKQNKKLNDFKNKTKTFLLPLEINTKFDSYFKYLLEDESQKLEDKLYWELRKNKVKFDKLINNKKDTNENYLESIKNIKLNYDYKLNLLNEKYNENNLLNFLEERIKIHKKYCNNFSFDVSSIFEEKASLENRSKYLEEFINLYQYAITKTNEDFINYQEKLENIKVLKKNNKTKSLENKIAKITNKFRNKNELLQKQNEIEKSMFLNYINNLAIEEKDTYKEIMSLYQEDSKHHLVIKDLLMQFGGLKAVNNLSFNVQRGEIFGLIGPNGAGKTTVFNCITQFYKPTSGYIYFKNNKNEVINLNTIKVHDVIKHGIVRTFQNVELILELTVLENLLVGAHTAYKSSIIEQIVNWPTLRREENVIKVKALKILKDLNILEYQNNYPKGLPYGILKRIELARTLMLNPELIILDEPAAGLNDTETKELAKTIRDIRDIYNVTIFLVEHDMGLVMDVCDRICAISFGKLLAIGTPKEIQENSLVKEAYLGGDK